MFREPLVGAKRYVEPVKLAWELSAESQVGLTGISTVIRKAHCLMCTEWSSLQDGNKSGNAERYSASSLNVF